VASSVVSARPRGSSESSLESRVASRLVGPPDSTPAGECKERDSEQNNVVVLKAAVEATVCEAHHTAGGPRAAPGRGPSHGPERPDRTLTYFNTYLGIPAQVLARGP
jgi:hypothetical protein